MDDRSIKHLERVAELLVQGELYLFAGAGLSCRVGIPKWTDLLNAFVSEYKKRPYHSVPRAEEMEYFAKSNNRPEFFEVMINEDLGRIVLIDVMKNYFCNDKCDIIHKEILDLPFKSIVTTNYDTCFENACTKYVLCPEMAESRWFCFPEYNGRALDIGQMLNGQKFLLHMHGCFWRSKDKYFEVENLVLAPSQYHKFYKRNEMNRILSELKDKYVLFIETSLTDIYFLNAMRELRKPKSDNERANAKEWFRLCSGKDCTAMRDEENFIMRHIHYDRNNDGLLGIIRTITGLVDSKKRGVSIYMDPGNIGTGRGI